MIDPLTKQTICRFRAKQFASVTLIILVLSPVLGSLGYGVWLGETPDSIRPWLLWSFRETYTYGDPYRTAFLLALFGPMIGLTVIAAGIAISFRFHKRESGGWSNYTDQVKAGLRNPRGLVLALALYGGAWLRAGHFTHLAVIAPTRSGKGIAVVITNSLTWFGSYICTDIKLENYYATAGFRSLFSDVFLYAPGCKKTARYNFLDLISRDRLVRIGDLQKLSHILAPTPEKSDPMWSSEARTFFVAVVLFLMDTEGEIVSLGNTYHFINRNDWSEESVEILLSRNPLLDHLSRNTFTRVSKMGEKQRAGISSSVMTALEIFADPLIDAATNYSDFDIRDLRKKRMSIYLGWLPSNFARLAPLFNLFIQQVSDVLVDDINAVETGHPVCLLLDEYPALGKMPSIITNLGFFAGFRVRVIVIAQNVAQLQRVSPYNDAEELLSAFEHAVYYAPNTHKGAKQISDDLGFVSCEQTSTTYSKNGKSTSESKKSKPLLDPGEVRQLNPKNAIIFQRGQRPTLARKFNYLKIRKLKKRTEIPAPAIPALPLGDHTRRLPNNEPHDEPADGYAVVVNAS